mmetsp:Transcript_56594/g.121872  ORF Transcript_56594/g.121872 Transcript_56594/m.121872 type:complete len:257 (-) Transcript_56594:93-863(-)
MTSRFEEKDIFFDIVDAIGGEVTDYLTSCGPLKVDGSAMPVSAQHSEVIGDLIDHLDKVAANAMSHVEFLRIATAKARRIEHDLSDARSIEAETDIVLKLLYVKRECYPDWWRKSALCKAIQIEICDMARGGHWECLGNVLKEIRRIRNEWGGGLDTESFLWWTELPVRIFQRYWHGLPNADQASASMNCNDASWELSNRILHVWVSVMPHCMYELQILKATVESHITYSRSLKIGTSATAIMKIAMSTAGCRMEV